MSTRHRRKVFDAIEAYVNAVMKVDNIAAQTEGAFLLEVLHVMNTFTEADGPDAVAQAAIEAHSNFALVLTEYFVMGSEARAALERRILPSSREKMRARLN